MKRITTFFINFFASQEGSFFWVVAEIIKGIFRFFKSVGAFGIGVLSILNNEDDDTPQTPSEQKEEKKQTEGGDW